jgi:murein DD-endopeptidase MepM/ murein hydrolase activator NlpD
LYSTQDISSYYHRNIEEYRSRNDPEAIKAVAKEMEALFAYELIKAMRKTTNEGTSNGLGKDTYMSMFDMELARLMSERGLGLQDMLLKELKGDFDKSGIRNQESGYLSPQGIEQKVNKLDNQIPTLEPQPFTFPVNGVISSNFGMRRHPIYGDIRFHDGIDIAAPVGTDIYPIKDGMVVFSGEQAGYGNVVIIDHGNGLTSKYAHNKVNFVKEGDLVGTHTAIACIGNSGNSTGPHLHLEISERGEYIDPVKLLARG